MTLKSALQPCLGHAQNKGGTVYACVDRFSPLGVDPRLYRKEQRTKLLGILFSEFPCFSAGVNDHYDLSIQSEQIGNRYLLGLRKLRGKKQ